jgi:hypothetical protein
VPKVLQIALFVAAPPRADAVAEACFPGQVMRSFMSQGDTSTSELEGEIERRVACSTSQGRIDFFWEARANPPLFSEENIDLGAVSDDLKSIAAFASVHAVVRVACVHTYRQRVSSASEAITLAKAELPNLPVPKGASELTYRINSPTDLDGLGVNRISQWHTAKLMFLGVGSGLPTHVIHEMWEQMIDINTLHETPLPAGSAGAALDKVVVEAVNVRSNGFAGL